MSDLALMPQQPRKSLIRQHKSSSNKGDCMLGKNFGCTDSIGSHMERVHAGQRWFVQPETVVWISAGCRGTFICNNLPVTCGHSGHRITGSMFGRRNCTCAGRKVDDIPMSLPATLGRTRLVEARQGEPRFVPHGSNETMNSIFVWWNILDAIMHASAGNDYQTGYVRELQMRRMVEIVQAAQPGRDRVTYCEIGTNGGHSSVAMMLADPRVHVHAFDLLAWRYSAGVVNLLASSFPHRFHMHKGSSLQTVPSGRRAAVARIGAMCSWSMVITA